MNEKFQITSDGTIFEVKQDGSINRLGHINDNGKIDSYGSVNLTETEGHSSKNFSVIFGWFITVFLAAVIILIQFVEKNSVNKINEDLHSQINKLEDQKKQLNLQINSLQTENQQLSQFRPIQISDLKVGVIDDNSNVIVDFDEAIYSSLTQFLTPKIFVFSCVNKKVKFDVKLQTPSGLSKSSSIVNSEYSYSSEHYLSSGKNTVQLNGWGSSSPGHWCSGSYRFEIWYKGSCLIKKAFTIY